MQTKKFLGALDHERIVKAIGEAEARSRGEVRVHVSGRAVDDPQPSPLGAAVQPADPSGAAVQAAAIRQFEALGMTKTAERNGVLLFVAPASQAFAVVGDRGIHERCGPDFWKDVAAAVEADFKAGRYSDGIVKGVARLGDALATHFPRQTGAADANELPDQVTED